MHRKLVKPPPKTLAFLNKVKSGLSLESAQQQIGSNAMMSMVDTDIRIAETDLRKKNKDDSDSGSLNESDY